MIQTDRVDSETIRLTQREIWMRLDTLEDDITSTYERHLLVAATVDALKLALTLDPEA